MTQIYQILILTIYVVLASAALQNGRPCQLKNGSAGTCTVQTNCDYAREKAREGLYSELVICTFTRNVPVVCCPNTSTPPTIPSRFVSSKRKSEQYCDIIKSQSKFGILPTLEHQILNGVPASVREFPHMVAIGFRESDDQLKSSLNWKCAGCLISRKFVLTAAHCLKKSIERVRVGGISLTGINHKSERPQEIKIKNNIKYPAYRSTSKYDDIALIELENEVDVTDGFARPLCLPTIDSKSVGNKYSISGWGFKNKTTLTDVLFKADVYELPPSQCKDKFKNLAKDSYELDKGIIDSQICAENKIKKSDTCQGDSGSPFFFKKTEDDQFYVYGVTSFGLATQCGAGGAPGIYTKVYPYLDWIEKTVWPGNKVNDF